MKAVFDTNILIDYLNGFKQAKKSILTYWTLISFVNAKEVDISPRQPWLRKISALVMAHTRLLAIQQVQGKEARKSQLRLNFLCNKA